MSHFKLIKLKNDNVNSMLFDSTQIEFDFHAETLEQMLEAYRDFLRGCGFPLDGNLEVSPDFSEADEGSQLDFPLLEGDET